MSAPRRAAVYVRISDDRAKDSAGVARQEDDARALAERLGWTVTEVITENDVSAYKRRRIGLPNGRHELRVVRPGFRQLLDMIVSGHVDGMIAYDLDRTARDVRDLEDLIDAVEQRVPRLPVESVTGSLRLANDSDVTMARVMVAIANKSSRDSSRRIKRKHDELAEQGKFAGGGSRRFGFEPDGVTLRQNEVEAVRWAAEQVLAGRSVRSVASDLDARGVRPVKAAKWSGKSLSDMLRSPRLAGQRVHRGEVVGAAAWPAVFDLDTHAALVATLHQRGRGLTQPKLQRWCNQLLFCSHCDRPLWGAYVSGNRPYRYWCATPQGGCGRTAIHGPKVEREVERQVLEYLERPDVVSALASGGSAQNADAARAVIAEDEAQLRTLAQMWAEKGITLDEYAAARQVIVQRLEGTKRAVLSIVPDRVRQVLAADDIAEAWSGLGPAERREVVQVVLESGGFRGWRVLPADQSRPREFDTARLELVPGE